jgi:uncharacterized SAM-binding protein YcdF (DUF218 family)
MKRLAHGRSERGGIVGSLIALLCLVVLCTLVYLLRHSLLRFAAESWVVDEPASRADAIIVLGDDNFYADRATRAAELSRQQIAPVVVASGRRLRPGAGIAELVEHDLLERGVPREKLLRLSHDADSTEEEADALARFAADHHWKSVIIVTSNYHARRVRYIFERVFPSDISTSVASARDGDFDPERWWEKRKSIKLFAREIAGMAVAIWELHGAEKKEAPVAGETKPQKSQSGPPCEPKEHIFSQNVFSSPLHALSAVVSSRFLVATSPSLDMRL